MILDAAGTDHYVAHIGVGTGIVGGAGVLLDLGQDIDHYNTTADPAYKCGLPPVHGNEYDADSGMLAQASFGGLALVFDEGGNDDIRTTGVDFAGSATLGSVALFLNNGTGSDTYRFKPGPYKGIRTGPGGGFGEGGVGILLEPGGNDQYICEGPVNYGCLGGGHAAGLGLHLDLAGDDLRAVYEPIGIAGPIDRTGFGRGAGAAQFAGTGVLFDGAGNDVYSGNYSIGYGACLGVGVLIDAGGDDKYSSILGSSIGWGNPGIAALLCEEIRPVGSGIFWDGGGADTYSAPAPACGSRSDGKAWRDGPGTGQASTGIGVDEPATDIATCS